MATAKVTVKGQITLPTTIRKHLNIHTGDQVEFIIDRSGAVRLTPVSLDIEVLYGRHKRTAKKSVEDMNAAIKAGLKRKFSNESD